MLQGIQRTASSPTSLSLLPVYCVDHLNFTSGQQITATLALLGSHPPLGCQVELIAADNVAQCSIPLAKMDSEASLVTKESSCMRTVPQRLVATDSVIHPICHEAIKLKALIVVLHDTAEEFCVDHSCQGKAPTAPKSQPLIWNAKHVHG